MTVENTSIVDAFGAGKDTGDVRLSIFGSRSQSANAVNTAIFVLASCLCAGAHAEERPGNERLFERVTQSHMFPSGGRETGLLRLGPASGGQALFQLEVTSNPMASDDGYWTRNGVIEEGALVIHGDAATYRSVYPEDNELVLLCHKRSLAFARRQHGHRGSVAIKAAAISSRKVVMDDRTW
ncbi:hypothetical protein ACIPRI_16060, partial [Variovorax sp. LARHSF232]